MGWNATKGGGVCLGYGFSERAEDCAAFAGNLVSGGTWFGLGWRGFATVEQPAEGFVAHQELEAQQQQDGGDAEHEQEFGPGGPWPVADERLQGDDQRQVSQVEPIGGIGDIADGWALAID